MRDCYKINTPSAYAKAQARLDLAVNNFIATDVSDISAATRI